MAVGVALLIIGVLIGRCAERRGGVRFVVAKPSMKCWYFGHVVSPVRFGYDACERCGLMLDKNDGPWLSTFWSQDF